MMRLAHVLLPLALAAAGCGLPTRAISSPTEYRDYRETRTAWTVEDRLAAAAKYLAAHPQGRFVAEVRATFGREEQSFYDQKSQTAPGLEWYLMVLPGGPHASEASLRLSDFEARAKVHRKDQLLSEAKTIEARLSAAAASRHAAVDTLTGWIGSIAIVRTWGEATWHLPGETLLSLRGWPDPARCTDRRCSRTRSVEFQVPVSGGGLEDRAATMDFVVVLQDGGVDRIEVRGPELFSRLFEASRGIPLDPDHERARAEAVGFALDLVGGAFESVAPVARCDRPIRPPVVMSRRCDGWSIDVTIGDTPADDDIVSVRGPR